MNIQETIERALAAAGLDTRSGPLHGVTETIRKALASAGLGDVPAKGAPAAPRARRDAVLDVMAREVPQPAQRATEAEPAVGQFLSRSYSAAAGSRDYKLYLPPQALRKNGQRAKGLPLVVMLHGCTQSADDFATGTQMNRLADAQGFIVVYPEQSGSANASRCWNWFRGEDQVRDGGEPELIAGITRSVAAELGVDKKRIFVAGLSAGASMAVILGQTHPELFAAVGAHSGLPYAAAHDIPSAMAAMKGHGVIGRGHFPGTPDDPRRPAPMAVPVIVFHGDRDHTVQQSNGEQIAHQALHAFANQAGKSGFKPRSDEGTAEGGRRYTRTRHLGAGGRCPVETWTLHGAGHAWSGGDAAGSFTDNKGPDASAEMLRFFLAQAPA